MSTSINIESGIKSLKLIVDNLRCGLCDKLSGSRLRYSCGHVACGACVATSCSCLLCLTPPDQAHKEPLEDQTLSLRVKHVEELLNTFQTLFNVDVSRYQRLSEQLKVEKEVFPQCIQAENKYYNICKNNNKRKDEIENSQKSVYAGEFVGKYRMDSFKYVEQWLENNDLNNAKKMVRKPFSDINVNSPRPTNRSVSNVLKTRSDLILNNVTESCRMPLKPTTKTHFKTTQKSHLKHFSNSKDKNKFRKSKLSFTIDNQEENAMKKNEKDESGIEVDLDTIVIDDSQCEIVDKDKLAWLAVLEAEQKQQNSVSLLQHDLQITNSSKSTYKTEKCKKVPFYKKSQLHLFPVFNRQTPQLTLNNEADIFKPVSISIENDFFKTKITVTNTEGMSINTTKKSVAIQTDENDCSSTQTIKICNKEIQVTEKMFIESQDIFTEKTQPQLQESFLKIMPGINTDTKKETCVVVFDSDSDDNSGVQVKVTADVHRSCEEVDYRVLAEIDACKRKNNLKRNRGRTPNSTDSSDKENCDPNRPKRQKINKKKSKASKF